MLAMVISIVCVDRLVKTHLPLGQYRLSKMIHINCLTVEKA